MQIAIFHNNITLNCLGIFLIIHQLECIANDLVTLGYLDRDETDYSESDLNAALLGYLHNALSTCKNTDSGDITLEMRCAANDYEGILKFTSSMAFKVQGSGTSTCNL